MAIVPFKQLRYEDVPELPNRRHLWNEARAFDVQIRTEELGDTRIAVREYGSGPPLLLVHGLMTAGYSFRYQLDTLGKSRRLLIPDLPGAGHSSHPDRKLTPDALAKSILATIEALDVRGVQVVGNSMGGYLSMRAAMMDPSAMRCLVNLHSPGLRTGRMTALSIAGKLVPAERIVDMLVRRDPARWVHKNVHYWDETVKSREEHREYAVPLSSPEGRRSFARHMVHGLDASEMDRFEEKLRSQTFPIPLCLVYTDKDPVVPPSVGDRLHKLVPQATFVRMKDASHFAHVDCPDRFANAIAPFLANHA